MKFKLLQKKKIITNESLEYNMLSFLLTIIIKTQYNFCTKIEYLVHLSKFQGADDIYCVNKMLKCCKNLNYNII